MAYTAEQIATLEAAIMSGQKRVALGDKSKEYQDISEMRAALREAKQEFSGATSNDPLRYRVGRFAGG